ncbi:MAG: radical SAM protein, partial [Symbiobacteriaceae bacterium]|nr:radical SAM protein [Symbiobacteriaceae bacterium]
QRLKELNFDWQIFYEVRPTLKKEQVKLLKEAGIVLIQPGIESLSTPLLQLMNKGTTALRNIQFLRWCQEYGIAVSYNMLSGLPGEKAEWYLEMALLFPGLYHLRPPSSSLTSVELHRFSPLFERSQDYGIQAIKVRADYAMALPPDIIDPGKVGYAFQFTSEKLAWESAYADQVKEALRLWSVAYQNKPVFTYRLYPGYLTLTDTRTESKRTYRVTDLYMDVVLLCDEIQTRISLAHLLSGKHESEINQGTLNRVVDELLAAGILLEEGNQLLTLPIGYTPRTTAELRSYVNM